MAGADVGSILLDFFFQAEDGIRDLTVTGVQTCALPIYSWKEIAAYLRHSERTVRRWQEEGLPIHRHAHKKRAGVYAYKPELDAWWNNEIGRASCRERV